MSVVKKPRSVEEVSPWASTVVSSQLSVVKEPRSVAKRAPWASEVEDVGSEGDLLRSRGPSLGLNSIECQ